MNNPEPQTESQIKTPQQTPPNPSVQTLSQLICVTWDGDLISKEHRDRLVKSGLAQRHLGFNWLTMRGIEYCVNLGLLKE